MKFYIKNTSTNEVLELEAKDKWLEEKPSDVDTHAYLCDRYIKTQSKNVRHLFSESSESEFIAQGLELAKKKKIIQCKDYLNKTDWYIIRLADSGDVVPDEVKTKRTQARDNIDIIEACTTFDKLNQINTDF